MESFANYSYFDDFDDEVDSVEWSEIEWRKYLSKIDGDISLFLRLFIETRNIMNHMEIIASQMGWIRQSGNFVGSLSQIGEKDPYTLHRQPVMIVTRALYCFLAKNWELFMSEHKSPDPQLCWVYGRILNAGERDAILALASMDAGDDNLALCHFKSALKSINYTMDIIQRLKAIRLKCSVLLEDAIIACFDLREVWLKVMDSCRNECDDDEDDEDE
ncbi:MAG: hypothetical protein LBH49_03790 [Puniceicoccales bacterium]|jgi:hypothetical protein|nr:hypothetical protein [Puniceicoccales bacterium]